MKTRGIHLQYRFGVDPQSGSDIENPLFETLSALSAAGSIQHAAAALGISYRHLWGSLKLWEAQLEEPLVTWSRGQPARLTPFAQRLLWSERQARTRLAPHIEALRHELRRVLDEALDGSLRLLRIDASHDLALPRLQALATERERLHLDLRFAGSLDALRSLADGRCQVAGFHVPLQMDRHEDYARALKPLLRPGRHKLIACMRRQQVLLLAPGNPLGVRTLADVVQRRLRFADREPGAGTHLLTDHLLRQSGLERSALVVSCTESSHVAAALAVASGQADASVGLRAAADPLGLAVVPLVEEDYFLVCMAEVLETPAMEALRRLLAQAGWHDTLATLPGYAPSPRAGEVLSLVGALPWWRFRSPRHVPRPASTAATLQTGP